MVVRATPERPMILTLGFGDRKIIDAGVTDAHQTAFIEFPILIPVRTKPIAGVVVPFVSKADGDPVVRKGPEFFD